jgi:hypothetical protein
VRAKVMLQVAEDAKYQARTVVGLIVSGIDLNKNACAQPSYEGLIVRK